MNLNDQPATKLPVRLGIWIGAAILPALMAVFYIGEQLAGLPFVPFDFFNWLTRILPGALVTFGIDRMVDVLLLLGLGSDLDSAAKTAEHILALVIFWVLGVLLVMLLFAILDRFPRIREGAMSGFVFVLIAGIPLTAISMQVNVSASAPQELQLIWMLMLFFGVGMLVNWAHDRLQTVASYASAAVVDQDRRQFIIRLGGATAMITVFGAGLGALLRPSEQAPRSFNTGVALTDGSGQPLPNADAALEPAPGTRLEYTPIDQHYRIDILAGALPTIPEDYRLPISGLVANPVSWTLDEIRAMPSTDAFITMSCISNRIAGSLISTTRWTGVSLQHILDQIQPAENAVALKIVGADGFDEFLSLELIRADERIMLAYDFDDAPLPLRNGYPLRVHIPDRYGMKQPKWITSIEVVASEEEGYWVRRGWSQLARVNATSVIDTVATDAIYTDAAGKQRVPVGGIAWAGDRRITAVEVQVDGGEWVPAQLRTPLSELTWVIWRYDWEFAEGSHTFAVRCYESPTGEAADAYLQVMIPRGTRPDGATGLHLIQADVAAPQPEA